MYDFSELEPTGKEMAVAVLVAAVLMVAIFSVGYMLGLRNAGTDIPDNGNSAQHVRDEIDHAGSNISAAKSGIDNAAATAGRIEARIEDAQERAGYVQGTVTESRRIVKECQSILREVRAGGQKGTAAN